MMDADDFLLDAGPSSSPTDLLCEFLKYDDVKPAKRARTEGVGIESLNENVWVCIMEFLRWWDRAALSKVSFATIVYLTDRS